MQSTRYNTSFDDMNFAIFDTIGLEEPPKGHRKGVRAYRRARCRWRHPPFTFLHAWGQNNDDYAEQLPNVL